MPDCQIPANQDVCGIGIRLSLYITMLLLAIIPDIPERTAPLREAIAGGAGLTGLSFLITAIVATHSGNLSLYHAIFIIHILYFTGIMVIPAGNYKRSALTRRVVVGGLLSYGSYLMFTGYAFYVWARAPTFGNNYHCNDQIQYIFFFRPVRATAGWLRKLWMVGLGFSLALLVGYPIISCMHICFQGFNKTQAQQGTSGANSSGLFKVIFQALKVLAVVYGIAMLELYERKNQHIIQGTDNEWTFGQTFAVAQLFGTLNEVLHWTISYFAPDSTHGDANSSSSRSNHEPTSEVQNPKPTELTLGPRPNTLDPGGQLSVRHSKGSSSTSTV